eukprot:393602-Pelagomonas_calceolata.AAC.2
MLQPPVGTHVEEAGAVKVGVGVEDWEKDLLQDLGMKEASPHKHFIKQNKMCRPIWNSRGGARGSEGGGGGRGLGGGLAAKLRHMETFQY